MKKNILIVVKEEDKEVGKKASGRKDIDSDFCHITKIDIRNKRQMVSMYGLVFDTVLIYGYDKYTDEEKETAKIAKLRQRPKDREDTGFWKYDSE